MQGIAEAYKLQWNLNIERQITSGLSITADMSAPGRPPSDPLRRSGPGAAVTGQDRSGWTPAVSGGTPQRVNPNFPLIPATLWNGYSVYHSGNST